MSNEVFITTGAQAQRSSPRLNIVSLQQNEKQFSLFVQALTEIKRLPSSVLLSHYQIAGIHGLPQRPWDNVPQTVSDPAYGYCHHGLQTFPTWHRPYVALYEQIVHERAKGIAESYQTDDKAEWLEAAENLRFPYWDWSSGQDVPSILISDPTVTIRQAPRGEAKPDYPNPFLSYTFQQEGDVPAWRNRFKNTVRFANPAGADSKSDPKALVANWSRVKDTLAKDVRDTLSTQGLSWYDFSNHTTGNTVPGANSIETLHDRLHVYFGQGRGALVGHMADPSVAAFDPVFFLHHCNVDRILLDWQRFNPNVWVEQGALEANGPTSLTEDVGSIQSATSNLTPFWRTQTSFWTSDACRDTDASLKYSYDRLPMDQASFSLFAEQNVAVTPMTKLSTAGIKATSKQALFATRMMSSERNGQDRPSAASKGDPDKEPTEQGPQSLLRNNDASEDVTQDLGLPFGPEVPQGPIQAPQAILYKKWSVRVRVDKECLAQSFAVEVYLMKDPQATTPDEDDFAGDFWTFVNSRSRACDNCNAQREAGLTVEGYVDLTEMLHQRLEINPNESQVKEYIQAHLFWQVIVNGTVIPPTDPRVASLQVTIISANARVLLGDIQANEGLPRTPLVIETPHEHVRLSGRTNERCLARW